MAGQTRWLSPPLMGFAAFRPFSSILHVPLGSRENVAIQSTASAMATMPLTASLVGVILALEELLEPSEGGPLHFTWLDLSIWGLGLSCSVTFLAMLLRKHMLAQENSPFPSATTSAMLIQTLNTQWVASGEVRDWMTGSKGWILWIALSILLTDCLTNPLWLLLNFEVVRAAQNSLNSHFALIVSKSNPDRLIINLVVGALSEAGAVQATSMMFDLKTGFLLSADPFSQMSAHVIGSGCGAFVSAAFYKLYTSIYTIPGPLFQAPTSYIWIAAARLAYGAGLPPHIWDFIVGAAVITAITTSIKIKFRRTRWSEFVPGGVAFAVGMYNAPAFTLPRFCGGLASWVFNTKYNVHPMTLRLVAASLIIGESIFSLVGLLVN